MKAISAGFLIVLSTCASAAEHLALPDPLVTPGQINPAATPETLCVRATREKPPLPAWVTEFELSSYNIPLRDRADYVLDYLIPLSLGGANTVSNLWPQPRADALKKARLETTLQQRVCAARLNLAPQAAAQVLTNAQLYLAEDWTAAYADYVER